MSENEFDCVCSDGRTFFIAMLLLLWSAALCARPSRAALRTLSSQWYGRIAQSPHETEQSIAPAAMECTAPKGEAHIACEMRCGERELRFFVRPDEDDADALQIVSRRGDDIARLSVHEQNKGETMLLRGVLHPANDQVTASLGFLDLSIAITDQFSANTTLIALRRESPNAVINRTVKIGLFATVFVAILVGLYKAADLSDVIRPEEGATAMRIKQMSIAADRRKRAAKAKEE